MKKHLKGISGIIGGTAAAVTLGASNAFADGVDLTGFTLDTGSLATLTVTILGGLGALWGIRKLIGLINRA